MDNIIAIDSYGSHRVKNAHTGQTVSAYKIGYSSAASAVLLALYGDGARDVSSKHATYHYIQIDAEVTIRHGYILLKVTDAELVQAETITRQAHRPAVYRWRNDAWVEFPSLKSTDYAPVNGRSGPNFNPTGMFIVSASTGEAEAAIAGIVVEKSQRGENDTPWHWIRGDTYPHRDLLKRWGCRWSKRQKAWYFIGQTLPEVVQALVSTPDSEDAPCSDEEAAAILGVNIQPKAQAEMPRLFALNETLYARHELETPDGEPIPTGTRGTITRLYNRNATHGWSYDVDFDGIGVGWFFERELTSLEPVKGIRITHGAVVPPGAVPPTDAEIKQVMIENGHPPEAIEPEQIDTAQEDGVEDEPKIRIIKPTLELADGEEPDAVITAIHQAKSEPLPVQQSSTASSSKRSLMRIPQSPCGELTGSISGNVWCYGFAVYEGIAIYINLGGPRMAVEAIRAKLSKAEVVTCIPWDTPAFELTAGEGSTGMYTAFTQNIPEAKFTSMILCHEMVTQPNYGGKSTTFIFHVSDEQAMAQLHQHVTRLVKVPVFPEWMGYLWQAGQAAMLVRKTRGAGGLDVLAVDLDMDSWTRLLTGGLAQGIVSLPR